MFQPQNFLVEAVNKQEIEQVRVALSTYLSKNPTNEQNEVLQAAEYAESRLSEPLWVVHDGLYIEKDSGKWTKDYLGQLKSDLRYNFSKERFEFIIEVGKKVRALKGNFPLAPVRSVVQPAGQPMRQPAVTQLSSEPVKLQAAAQVPSQPVVPAVSPSAIKTTTVPTRVVDAGKPNTKWLVIAGLGGIAILGVALFLLTRNHK
ncbi:hypothetical protein [Paenibacillus ihuae]|uniref:hypothetical protein n=1 Tax=Paenibacillus ihuae TaxID=1232431 RepID=UPI0006D5AB5A|nr:hypothetical protein [Paenibacillus ihuae]